MLSFIKKFPLVIRFPLQKRISSALFSSRLCICRTYIATACTLLCKRHLCTWKLHNDLLVVQFKIEINTSKLRLSRRRMEGENVVKLNRERVMMVKQKVK